MQQRARIGITLLVLAIAGGLAFGFAPRAIEVDAVAAVSAPLAVTIEEEGKSRVMDRFVISAPVAGYARRIDLNVGDAVQKDQVLAQLEPARSDALDPRSRAQMQAQLNGAQAAVAAAMENARAAEAQAKLAQQELERAESLRKVNFVSEQALDRARTEVTRTQAVKLAAQHSVNMAKYDLENVRATLASTSSLQGGKAADILSVRAPVAARVLRVTHESEGLVQPGQALLEIGNPETLEIEVEVLSTQAVQIAPGAKVLLDRWGGDVTLQGAVRTIEPTGFTKISALGVEEQRVRVIVDITSPREVWRRLGDGYRVEARFVIWEEKDILQIPASALFRHGQGWAAFVVAKGRATIRTLVIGQRAGLTVQVLSGIKAGEQVITHPEDKIKDGGRVKVRG